MSETEQAAEELAGELIDAVELAAKLGISRWSVYDRVSNGMPHYRLGPRAMRFRLSEVLAWMREEAEAAPPSPGYS